MPRANFVSGSVGSVGFASPEDDLAVTDFRLEEEAPPFDVEAGAARLREAARSRRVAFGPDIAWPNSYRPPDPRSRRVPFGPDIAWPYGFRQLDPESREVLESAYGTGPIYEQRAMDDYGHKDPGRGEPQDDEPQVPAHDPHWTGRKEGAARDRARHYCGLLGLTAPSSAKTTFKITAR